MNKETGGAAFPIPKLMQHAVSFQCDEGMTLRDYFAAKAMQAIVSTLNQDNGEPFWNVIAKDSYKMADAMLEARK